ncbi:extracellular solute-binding protein [Chitinimonas sp. BJYL2]|uniref:extracellular solute-binding protein n=1 Tax=Chitinimonas sp. BJYL2 TaxID=2976696 RepID=UPI0022B428BC|nr:extracellular solute-binding protein [Chitinimonas sp. BJYL2]
MAYSSRSRWLAALAALTLPLSAWSAHAYAQFGQPKYPADFAHFDYVNPAAPKGGKLTLSVVSQNSSFDKFNPFTLKGRPAPGLTELLFETLTVLSLDEPNTQYGLLAEDIDVAPDFSAVTFRLRPQARFNNGDPVTAADVVYSFRTLTSKAASPRFKSYFAEIASVEARDVRTVHFTFKRPGRDLPFVAGSLPVFSPKWGRNADGSTTAFDALRLETPVASGPYLIDKAQSGADIRYRLNPDYWARELPVRRGFNNFGLVIYKLYKDRDTQVAGLRALDYDFMSETQMRYWCCQYIGKHFNNKTLIKEVLPHQNPPAMNGWVVNLRRERFRDPNVRLALNHALDFEWINDKIFASEFKRVTSYFTGTPLAATGLPGADELKLLEPHRAELPPEVFGPMFEQPSNRQPGDLRRNLTRALELFAKAGWHNRDGVLRNAKGEPFVIDISAGRTQSPFMEPIYLNLSKLGIQVRKVVADAATTRERTNRFDFDYLSVNLRESRLPASELWRVFNSKAADRNGSENLAGVKSAAVDDLLQKLQDANTPAEQQTAARALDRVLIHSHYFIPWRYLTHHYLMYHQRLKRPSVLPRYYGGTDWAVSTWWDSTATTPATPLRQAGRPQPATPRQPT